MVRVLEKVERRLGERLFLKAERCSSPKCACVRRNYIPGAHGQARRKGGRSSSEYSRLLKEKQKVRYLYGLNNSGMERYSEKASAKSGSYSANLLTLLEKRLDNVLFRLGLADSRRVARQLISHGHVTINGKTVNIPSYSVKKGEVICLKEKILKSPALSNLENRLKKYDPPKWLSVDKNKKCGTILGNPEINEGEIMADVSKIKEFYSR